jgi:riboflavin kinase/FMN adenylyltransferase
MRLHRHYHRIAPTARGAVVAIGNFDGVHRGHQAVLRDAAALAAAAAAPLALLTFEPHPRRLFQPDAEPFRLTSLRAKARLLAGLGVAHLFVQRFDRAFSQLTAEDFIDRVLLDGLGAAHVVVGTGFRFGKGRGGDVDLLRRRGTAAGFAVSEMAPVRDPDGVPYASTRIRAHLRDGAPELAAVLLGRAWEMEGRVVHGDRRGHSIGFPTANLAPGAYLRPAHGVYAVRAAVADEDRWIDGVANFGRRPTVGGGDPVLESHLFDFDADLYGRRLRVALHAFLRPERKFDGLEALRAQIAQDREQAAQLLRQAPAQPPPQQSPLPPVTASPATA